MTTLPPQYDPKISEPAWQKRWEEAGVYHFRDDLPREQTFVIDTPPPTVSGILHMGHIFSYTQADFIARYKRMRGFDVFYPMGFDDNGLPTERLVEKTKNVRGNSMPRADFVALCKEVVVDAENEFRRLFKSTALSVDWRQEYQTINENVQKLSQASFLDLLAKGEAYRDFRPGYWDWVDQTAIATAEIEEKEIQGIQITIPFGIMDANKWNAGERPTFESLEKVHVMTTRPELLGACVALMIHPDDKNKYDGKVAVSPLFNVLVPICADEKVDKEKGTGFVMCCSWGDDTDKEWIAKHNLAWRPLIGKNGKITIGSTASENGDIGTIEFDAGKDSAKYSSRVHTGNCLNFNNSISVYKAIEGSKLIRDVKNENSAKGKALKLLEEAGLLISQGENQDKIIHKIQMVKCAERSGTPIEIIPTSQWFIKLTDKKEALLAKGAEVNWHPQHMKIRLDQWIGGLKEDWCISRQRFFGVPFPIWYSKRAGEEGKIIAATPEQLPIDPTTTPPKGYTMDEVQPDVDVMDTWATSSITPQINSHSVARRNPDNKKLDPDFRRDDDKLFPADVRPQAHEIIRTWAFYTIAKAHLHTNTVPWKNIMISGWCLAADKTKMSKSKGNVVTPVDLIAEKGTDAVRYWASTSRLATDTAFSEDLLKIGRKLVNKLWNASSFIAQVAGGRLQMSDHNLSPDTRQLTSLDRWILSRLHRAISKATKAFDAYEYCDARVAIEDFFWNDFCDNYLELVKARAYAQVAGDSQQMSDHNLTPDTRHLTPQDSALLTLTMCLNAVLRLFAPFVPHICEEIYSHLFADKGSVNARGMWPNAADYAVDEQAEKSGMAAVEILEIIRKAKSEANVSIKAPVARVQIFVTDKASLTFANLAGVMEDLKAAGSVHEIVQSNNVELPYTTRDGAYKISVELAKLEEVKRNSEQKPDEKIEGKILSGQGNPDLSKHVVKVQVASLATSIERQK